MQFVQRMFDLLEQQGKKKADLARFLGVRPTTVTEWSTKGKQPLAEYISRISEFLNVSNDYLLTGKEKTPTILEDEAEVLEMYRKLDKNSKTIIKAKIIEEQRLQESTQVETAKLG